MERISSRFSCRLRCLLHAKGLVICFYLGWSGCILQFRQNKISRAVLLTCISDITLSLPSYNGSALKRELNFCNGYLSLLCFWLQLNRCETDLYFLQNFQCTTILIYGQNWVKFGPHICWMTTNNQNKFFFEKEVELEHTHTHGL